MASSPLIHIKQGKLCFTIRIPTSKQNPIQPWKSNTILMPRGENSGIKESSLSPLPPLSNSSSCYMCKKVPDLMCYAYFPSLCYFILWFLFCEAPLTFIYWIFNFWAWISLFNHNLNEPKREFWAYYINSIFVIKMSLTIIKWFKS